MIEIAELQAELTDDPLSRGYSTMTDQEVVDDLNTAYRTKIRTSIKGSEIFNALVLSEYGTLSDAQRQRVEIICQLGDDIDVSAGTNVRDFLLDAFGPGTTTRSNLAGLTTESITRAKELGWGKVTLVEVRFARQ